jgi:hypothetical protein
MIIIVGIALWLTSSFLICLLSFWTGRCARRLPVIDDHMPWTMSRDQAPRCPADCNAQHPAPSDATPWGHNR